MPRIILAFRDPDLPDHLSVHAKEAEAHTVLAAFDRRQRPRGRSVYPAHDNDAIDAWFGNQGACYAIDEVSAACPPRGALS